MANTFSLDQFQEDQKNAKNKKELEEFKKKEKERFLKRQSSTAIHTSD